MQAHLSKWNHSKTSSNMLSEWHFKSHSIGFRTFFSCFASNVSKCVMWCIKISYFCCFLAFCTHRCTFLTSEQCTEWQRRITLAAGVPSSLEVLFAFPYYAWASELQANHSDSEWFGHMQRATNYDDDFRREVKRLEFNTHTSWRISTANIDFKLCPTYPRLLLVPMCITDDILTEVAAFRSARRIPSVVWRHKPSG